MSLQSKPFDYEQFKSKIELAGSNPKLIDDPSFLTPQERKAFISIKEVYNKYDKCQLKPEDFPLDNKWVYLKPIFFENFEHPFGNVRLQVESYPFLCKSGHGTSNLTIGTAIFGRWQHIPSILRIERQDIYRVATPEEVKEILKKYIPDDEEIKEIKKMTKENEDVEEIRAAARETVIKKYRVDSRQVSMKKTNPSKKRNTKSQQTLFPPNTEILWSGEIHSTPLVM